MFWKDGRGRFCVKVPFKKKRQTWKAESLSCNNIWPLWVEALGGCHRPLTLQAMEYVMAAGSPLRRCQHRTKICQTYFTDLCWKIIKQKKSPENFSLWCHFMLHLLRFTDVCAILSISLLELLFPHYTTSLNYLVQQLPYFIWNLIPFLTFSPRLQSFTHKHLIPLVSLSFTHLICFISLCLPCSVPTFLLVSLFLTSPDGSPCFFSLLPMSGFLPSKPIWDLANAKRNSV